MDLFTESSADFSSDGAYRYRLTRNWAGRPAITWVLLNPSTADELRNDATLERCQRRSMWLGYGTMHIANIFALRSPTPDTLRQVQDPIGPRNDDAIVELAAAAECVVSGWGHHGDYLGRADAVLALLRGHGIDPHALALTRDGHPRHPLYVPYAWPPQPLPQQ